MAAEGDFTLTLAGGLTFTRRDDTGLLELRFTDDALGGGRTVRRARWAGGPLTVDLVADRSALEFYCDDGRLVFATRWYPGEPAVPVALQGGRSHRADAGVHDLHPVNHSVSFAALRLFARRGAFFAPGPGILHKRNTKNLCVSRMELAVALVYNSFASARIRIHGGCSMITMAEIARLTHVSQPTVSRVLNGNPKVSPEIRERVLACAREHDYQLNALAKGLTGGPTHLLGVLVTDISNGFFADLAKEIETAAREQGYSILLFNSDYDPDREQEYLDVVRRYRVDGVLAVPIRETSPQWYDYVQRLDVPVVTITRRAEGLDSFYADHAAAGARVAAYLAGQGYERFLFIGKDYDGKYVGFRRLAGGRGPGRCRDQPGAGRPRGFPPGAGRLAGPGQPPGGRLCGQRHLRPAGAGHPARAGRFGARPGGGHGI